MIRVKAISCSLSPNTFFVDALVSFVSLFFPWWWKRGSYPSKLEKKFAGFLQIPYVFSLNSGRSCLYVTLKALGVNEGDEVLVPGYTCVVVPNAVLACGAKPVFVDSAKDSFNTCLATIKSRITPRTQALVLQHTFGLPVEDSERIINFCRKRGIAVIEDCAHALGAEYGGKKVGTLGDAGFFSLGRDKIISSSFGGLLVTSDRQLARRIERVVSTLAYPPLSWIGLQLLYSPVFWIIRNFFNFFYLGKILLVIVSRLGIFGKSVFPSEYYGETPPLFPKRLPKALALLGVLQLQRLEKFNASRERIAKYYLNHLRLPKELLPRDVTDRVWLRFTIRMPNPKELVSFAKKRGVFLGNWYSPNIAPPGVDLRRVGYTLGSCPQAELMGSQSINLPCTLGTSLKEAKQVCDIVNAWFDQEVLRD